MPGQKYTVGRGNRPIEITLPSLQDDGVTHNVALIKRPDPQALIRAGLLAEFDNISGLVALRIGEIEGKSEEEQLKTMASLAGNMDQLEAAFTMIDRVLEVVVVEPKVIRPVKRDGRDKPMLTTEGKEIPLTEGEKFAYQTQHPDTLFTDEVDTDDRMFIFQFALGGSKDLDAFREGTAKLVGGMEAIQDVPLPS